MSYIEPACELISPGSGGAFVVGESVTLVMECVDLPNQTILACVFFRGDLELATINTREPDGTFRYVDTPPLGFDAYYGYIIYSSGDFAITDNLVFVTVEPVFNGSVDVANGNAATPAECSINTTKSGRAYQVQLDVSTDLNPTPSSVVATVRRLASDRELARALGEAINKRGDVLCGSGTAAGLTNKVYLTPAGGPPGAQATTVTIANLAGNPA